MARCVISFCRGRQIGGQVHILDGGIDADLLARSAWITSPARFFWSSCEQMMDSSTDGWIYARLVHPLLGLCHIVYIGVFFAVAQAMPRGVCEIAGAADAIQRHCDHTCLY